MPTDNPAGLQAASNACYAPPEALKDVQTLPLADRLKNQKTDQDKEPDPEPDRPPPPPLPLPRRGCPCTIKWEILPYKPGVKDNSKVKVELRAEPPDYYQWQATGPGGGTFDNHSGNPVTMTKEKRARVSEVTATSGQCTCSTSVPPRIGPIHLYCKAGWSECQKKQARAKVRWLNEAVASSGGSLERQEGDDSITLKKKYYQGMYRDKFNDKYAGRETSPDPPSPAGNYNDFMDMCLWNEFQNRKLTQLPRDIQADHIQDTQWSGNVKGPFLLLDESVNTSMGNQMQTQDNNGNIDVATEFILHCD